jgi:hypothetical protein
MLVGEIVIVENMFDSSLSIFLDNNYFAIGGSMNSTIYWLFLCIAWLLAEVDVEAEGVAVRVKCSFWAVKVDSVVVALSTQNSIHGSLL